MDPRHKVFGLLWVVGGVLLFGLKHALPLTAPFLLGLFFACLIQPFIVALETRLHLKREIAIAATLLSLSVLFLLLLGLTIVFAYQESQRILAMLPSWTRQFSAELESRLDAAPPFLTGIKQLFSEFCLNPEFYHRMIRSIFMGIFRGFARFPQMMVTVLLGTVSAYFFSRDQELLRRWVREFAPKSWQGLLRQLTMEVAEILARFFRLEFGLVFLTIGITTLWFWVLGIPGAPAYGLLAGFLDIIPVLGPGLIYLPITLGSCWTGNYVGAMMTLGVYFIILLIRQALEMRVIGKNLNIHPLLTLIVLYIGMKYLGFTGFFFGPFLIISLRCCYRVLTASITQPMALGLKFMEKLR